MTKSALWQQLATYPAQLDRQLIASAWPVPGRLTGMAVTVSTGRVVNIAPGSFVVPLAAGAGSALCISDAVETATFAAAPGSGSSRIDLLVVQVHDIALDSGSSNGFTFDVVLGTASSTPAPPTVPARAAVLAYVTSVGGQANLTQANIAPQNERLLGGVLGANISLPANTPTTILTTPPLGVGTWELAAQATIDTRADAAQASLLVTVQSGAATFIGPYQGHASPALTTFGVTYTELFVRCFVVVTAAAVLAIKGVQNAGAGGNVISSVAANGVDHITGWTANPVN